MQVRKGILVYACDQRDIENVHMSYLLAINHIYNDINASFGRYGMNLHEHDYPTISPLMKSYMDMEKVPIIPHMIEKLPNCKVFINDYIPNG